MDFNFVTRQFDEILLHSFVVVVFRRNFPGEIGVVW